MTEGFEWVTMDLTDEKEVWFQSQCSRLYVDGSIAGGGV